MIHLEIKEDTFSRKSSSNYELSILQRMDSFVYMVTDDNQQIHLLKSYDLPASAAGSRASMEEIFRGDSFLRQPFRSIRIAIASDKFTIVPNRLYNPREKEVFLQQVTDVPSNYELRQDDLPGTASQLVYALPEIFLSFYRQHMPGSRFFHQLTPLMTGYRPLATHYGKKQVFLNISQGGLQIAFLKDGDIRFLNTFAFQSTADLIYFVMLVFDQHELEPENTPIHLSGQVLAESEIYMQLRRYFRNVEFLAMPALLRAGPKLLQQPGHLFFDLCNLLLCN